jgi:fatty acid-binding protein DegV
MNPSPSPTAIVTDSAADLPAGVAEAHAICVIPAILVVDGESFTVGVLADLQRRGAPA